MYTKKNKIYKSILQTTTLIILPTILYYLTKIDIELATKICTKTKIPFDLNITILTIGFGYEMTIILLTLQLSLLFTIIYNCNKKINMIK